MDNKIEGHMYTHTHDTHGYKWVLVIGMHIYGRKQRVCS